MFYLIEIKFRLKNIFWSFFLFLVTCYMYRDFLLIYFPYLLFHNNFFDLISFNHFIYTDPLEVIFSYLLILTIFIYLFFFPYFVWQIMDLLKPGLYLYEYTFFSMAYKKYFIVFLIGNFFFFKFFLSDIWGIYEIINYFSTFNVINIYYELKIYQFYLFIYKSFFNFNFFLILILLFNILLFSCFNLFITYFSLIISFFYLIIGFFFLVDSIFDIFIYYLVFTIYLFVVLFIYLCKSKLLKYYVK